MMFQNMRGAANNVKSLILLDLKHLFRRVSTYTLLVLLALIIVGFALCLGTFHHLVSGYAPMHGVSNPKYGMGGYEPLLFYLCILVSLVLALRLPKYREDSLESVVITHRAPSNFLLALARALTATLLVAVFLIALALAYQGIAAIDVSLHPGIVEVFEPWSLAFVLINLCFALFFWASLALLICEVFSSGAIAFVGTALILTVQAIVSPLLPWDLGSFTFGYSAASLFPTDIAPDYFLAKHFVYWLSVFCMSIALISATATFHDRTDQAKRRFYIPLAISLTSICVVCHAAVHTNTIVDAIQRQTWIQAYEEASRTLEQHTVVKSIEGNVRVLPGTRVDLNLSYTIALQNLGPKDQSKTTKSLASFALNPGLRVREISCNEVPLVYTHNNGILELDLSSCKPVNGEEHELSIRTSGDPNPYYLINHVPQNTDSDISPQMVRLMGQRSSVFTRDYIALTPMSHWYPRPLQSPTYIDNDSADSSFAVNLGVELKRESWSLVTARGELLRHQDAATDSFAIQGSYQSLALIASDFSVEQHAFEDLVVNVLVHKRHERRVAQTQLLKDGIVRYVSEAISTLSSHGIEFPYSEFSVVEVPTTLSLLNKNRGTDLEIDSMLMFQESTLPFARLDRLHDMLSAVDDAYGFFAEQVEYGISYYWTNCIFSQTFEDAVIQGVLKNLSVTGEHHDHSLLAKLVVEQLLLTIFAAESTQKYRFDFEMANELSNETTVNLRYISSSLRGMITRYDLREFLETLLNSHSFWESIERSFFARQIESHQQATLESDDYLRKQKFRVLKLSEMINTSFNQDSVATTVATIVASAESNPVDLDLISDSFQSSNLSIQPLIKSSLLNDKLPGVHFSVVRQVRLDEPDDQGNNYVSVLHVRSGEDATAHLWLESLEFREVFIESIAHQAVAGSNTLGPIELQGKTSYTLVMRTENRVGETEANTFLSLNRGRLEIPVQDVESLSNDLMETVDDSQWYSLVPSQWRSEADQNIIVIDDLDPGFEFARRNPSSYGGLATFGSALFRSFHPREKGQDNGLPIASYIATHTGIWARSSWAACWGRYRHTYVFADTSKKPIQEISFNAELFRSGRWSLSYHFPSAAWNGSYKLSVSVGRQNWELSRDQEDWHEGWNRLGILDIEEQGVAKVSLGNESNVGYVFADAVKWTYMDSE